MSLVAPLCANGVPGAAAAAVVAGAAVVAVVLVEVVARLVHRNRG